MLHVVKAIGCGKWLLPRACRAAFRKSGKYIGFDGQFSYGTLQFLPGLAVKLVASANWHVLPAKSAQKMHEFAITCKFWTASTFASAQWSS